MQSSILMLSSQSVLLCLCLTAMKPKVVVFAEERFRMQGATHICVAFVINKVYMSLSQCYEPK